MSHNIIRQLSSSNHNTTIGDHPTYLLHALLCSLNELWAGAIQPEDPSSKVGVVFDNEVNHWLSGLQSIGALYQLEIQR